MSHLSAATRLLPAISLVVALAGGCGGGGGGSPTSPPPPPTTNTVTVEIRDFAFSPRSVTIQSGDTVIWRLTGSAGIGHSVTDGAALNSGATFNAMGAQYSHTFTAADNGKTFQYYCTAHKVCCSMQGSVRVGSTAPPPPIGYD